jgi:23S rRNA (adenine2030-N6)-methyltransferase
MPTVMAQASIPDRLVANELHPADGLALAQHFDGDERVRVTRVDAYQAIKAELPPPSRRGVLLIDAPFEVGDDWDRMVQGLSNAQRRFATGTTVIWYPRKDLKSVVRFQGSCCDVVNSDLLLVELDVCDKRNSNMLFGNGLIIHNPPFRLDAVLKGGLPLLVERLKTGAGAGFRLEWLRPPI